MDLVLQETLDIPCGQFTLSPDGSQCAIMDEGGVRIFRLPQMSLIHDLQVQLTCHGVFLSDNSLLLLRYDENPLLWNGQKLKKLVKWPLGMYDSPQLYRVDDHAIYFETQPQSKSKIWRFGTNQWRPEHTAVLPGEAWLYHCDAERLYIIRRFYPEGKPLSFDETWRDRLYYDLIELTPQGEILCCATTERPLETRDFTRPMRTPKGNILLSTLSAPARDLPEPPAFVSFQFTPDGRAYIPGESQTHTPYPSMIPMLYLLDPQGQILQERTDAEDCGRLFPVGPYAALVCEDRAAVSFWEPDTLERLFLLEEDFFGPNNAPTFVAALPDKRVLVGSRLKLYVFRAENADQE